MTDLIEQGRVRRATGRHRRRTLAWGGLAGGVVFGLWLASATLPESLTRWAFATVQTRWGIVVTADQVDLDLVALRARVETLTLAATGAEDRPFLTLAAATVDLPWSALLGSRKLDRVELVAPAVVVRQSADGTTNLPPPSDMGRPSSPSDPWRLGVVAVEGASVSWVDDTRGLSLVIDPIELHLQPEETEGGRSAGLLTLSGQTPFTWGDRETLVAPLSTAVAIGLEGLSVTDLVATAPEGRLAVSGEVMFGASAPSVDLDYRGDLDLASLASWIPNALGLSGAVHVTGRVQGPAASPAVGASLAGRAAWHDIEFGELVAIATLGDGRVTIEEASARLAGGTVEGAGAVTLTGEESAGNIRLSWEDVSADRLSAQVWPDRPMPIESTLGGTAEASWSGHDPADLTVSAQSRHRASTNGRLPVEGRWSIESGDNAWRVVVDRLSAGALSLTGSVSASVPTTWPEFDTTSITGDLETQVSDLQDFGEELTVLDLPDTLATVGLTGAAALRLAVSGSIRAPELTGQLTADGRLAGRDDEIALRAALAAAGGLWQISNIDVRLGASTLQGSAQLRQETGVIAGQLTLRIPDLAGLDVVPLAGWRPDGAIVVDGALSGHWPDPVLDARLAAEHLQIAGQRLVAVDSRVRATRDGVVVQSLAARQDRGQLDANAEWTRSTGRYTLSLTGRDLRLDPWIAGGADPLPLGATVDLELTGSGSIDDPRGSGRVVLRDLAYGDVRVDRTEHELTLTAEAWRIRSVAPSLAVTSDLTITPGPPWRYRMTAALTDGDLARLTEAVTGRDELTGVVSVSATAEGQLTELAASDVVLDLARLQADRTGLRIELGAPARALLSTDELRFDRPVDLRVGGSRLAVSGALRRNGDLALTATLSGDLQDVRGLMGDSTVWPDAADLDLTGAFTLETRVSGSLERPSLVASIAVDGGAAGGVGLPPLTDLQVRAAFDAAGGLRLGQLGGRWAGATIRAEGAAPASVLATQLPEWLVDGTAAAEPARFTVVVDGLGPDALAAVLAPDTRADLSGEIGFEGAFEADRLSLSDLRGTLAVSTLDLQAAGLPVTQQQPTRFTLADRRVTVDRLAWQFGAATSAITLGGHVDLTPEPTADLTVTGVADLGVLNAWSSTTAVGGEAYLVANLRGTRAAPSVDGVVEITNGELRVSEPRLLVTDLNGALVFQGPTMRTLDLTGTANGGPLRIDSDIQFSGFRPEGVVTLRGSEIAMVLPPGVRTELEPDLRLTIAGEDLELGGTLTVVRGDYREAVSTAGGLRALLESRGDPTRSVTEPSILDGVRLNVRVLTRDEIVVNNNYGAGSFAVDTRLGGTVGRPGVTGRLTIGDGGQLFLGGNTFEIERGTVDLVDPDAITPQLDVTARTRVGDQEITITLEGTADTLTTTMRSSDGLPESDIVSLLLTGRTLDEVGRAPGAVARDQALGLVSGQVLGVAGRSVGLDTVRLDRGSTQGDVRFDSSLVAGDTNPGTRLTVAKSLSRQVELVASQNLRQTGLITWIVNYLPRRNVELRLVVDDETDRSFEFRHAVTFGQTRPATPGPTRIEPRVTAVRFSGTPGMPESELRRRTRLKPGDRFDFIRWQDGRERIERALWNLGYQEARVRSRRTPDPDANTVDLNYDVQSGPRSVLDVRGYELPTALRRDMEAAWRASVFDAFLVDELGRLTRRQLAREGLLRPNVAVQVVDADDGEEKRLTIDVDPGPRSKDSRIRFEGHDLFPVRRLQGLLTSARAADAWAGGDELVQVVERTYQTEGWLAADAELRNPVFSGDRATLTLAIEEGRLFHVSAIDVEGRRLRSADDVRRALGVRSGDVYRAGVAEDARASLLAEYRAGGFANARVRVATSVDLAAAAVTLTVSVDEGRRHVLDTVAVNGADGTNAALISRALQLVPGEPVNPLAWNQARKRLYDTGVFRSVDITAVPTDGETPGADGDQPVRAQVVLEERPRYRLRYGVQLINEKKPAGEASGRGDLGAVADLTRHNLFGRGILVGSAARYDTVQQAARGFVVLPSLFGRAVTSNLFVSRLHETFGPDGARAITDRSRLTLEQQFTPRDRLTVSYSYNFERNRTFDADLDLTDPFAFDLTIDIARLSSSAVVERRDDQFDATRGWFHASTLEWGVAQLGSDLRFLKYVGQHTYYRPVGAGLVLASAARVGLGRGFGQELIPSERFFAGGGTTVRGYAQDTLGPTDFFGDSRGGQGSIVLNQEVRFPVWGPLQGVGFLDVGNVFGTVRDISWRDLKAGTGLGLRTETPIGLFRIDYGFPLTREDTDPVGRWFFSIGQAF